MRVIVAFLMMTFPLCAQQAKPQAKATLADWQTSYLKFAAEVVSTPASEDASKFYDKEVRYEGVFNEISYNSEDSDRKHPKLSLDLPKRVEGVAPSIVINSLWLRPSAVDSWKEVAKGAKVRIRGKVEVIVRDRQQMGPMMFNVYVLRVKDVELIGIGDTNNKEAAPAKAQGGEPSSSPDLDLSGGWDIDGERWELKLDPKKEAGNPRFCAGSKDKQVCVWVDKEKVFHAVTSTQGIPLLFCVSPYNPASVELKGTCQFGNPTFGGKLVPTPHGLTAKRLPKP